jgi:hypothetical protein
LVGIPYISFVTRYFFITICEWRYLRYTDDSFTIYDQKKRTRDETVAKLNKQRANVKFAAEKENTTPFPGSYNRIRIYDT